MTPLATISDALRDWSPCSVASVADALGIDTDAASAGLLALRAISCARQDGGTWTHLRAPHPRAYDVRPILEALLGEEPTVAIAARVGIPRCRVRLYRRALSIDTSARTVDEVAAMELKLGGATYADVATVLGCSYGGARHAIDRMAGRGRR